MPAATVCPVCVHIQNCLYENSPIYHLIYYYVR